jgi:glycine oxidase
MTQAPDVLIIGAGAVGAATARAVAARGAHVTLLESPSATGEAWRASAGMLAAQIECAPDDPLFDFSLAGRGFLRRNAAPLRDSTGVDIGLLECGILQVVHHVDGIERAKTSVALQRQQSHRTDWLSSDEVRDTWPWLGPCLGSFWSPDDGALDPLRLVAAFRADASRHGARLIEDTVVGLDLDGDRLCGVIGEHRRYTAPVVVIAAGAWSGRLTRLPRPLSVEPVRGQMFSVPWPVGVTPAVVYGDHCYLLARGDEMLVGSTMEHAGFDATSTESAIADLKQRASLTYPGLAATVITRSWAGLRPGSPDGLPIIGPEPRLPGLWYATGHGRNGILLSGVTGEIIAQAIVGEPLTADVHAFRPERFWDW